MPTLGPYIKFTEQTATHWCYLEIKPGVIKYYEALYTDLVDGLIWQESVLPDDNYFYDPKTKKALGYFMRSDQLYQIPLQILNTQTCVNQVLEIKLINNEITTPLAPRRAKTFNVDLKLYPDTKHFNIEKIPLLINDLTDIEAPLDIDAGSAHDCLKVSRCLIINDETQVPVILSDNIMYVWKIAEEWLFTVGFLGEVRSGKFDQELDQKVTHVFNTLESDNYTEIDLATFDFMQVALTRPYLILSHEQQTKVISTFMCSWPLDDNLSRIENIQICRSVVTGIVLN